MNSIYECHSVRMARYLYSLGFDKESKFDKDGKEYWVFLKSPKLQKALDFFYTMRKQK